MKKVILMFPGQGSQTVGMGKEFYDKFPASKNIIDKLDDELKNIIEFSLMYLYKKSMVSNLHQ